MSFFDMLAGLLAPNRCIFCGGRLSAGYRCSRCGGEGKTQVRRLNVPMGRESKMLKVYSPYIYAGFYRRCLQLFKFRGKRSYGESFASFIMDTVKGLEADVVTAVPMTEEKVKKRGYNQSELIGRGIARILGAQYRSMLIKVKDNRPQHSLSAEERRQNVKGAFAAHGDILGQNIILVDDIITTGSTIRECAKVLYWAGAASVTGVCAADVETKPIEKAEG